MRPVKPLDPENVGVCNNFPAARAKNVSEADRRPRTCHLRSTTRDPALVCVPICPAL